MEGEGDEIKSKQASKRDRTFKRGINWKKLFWESSLDSIGVGLGFLKLRLFGFLSGTYQAALPIKIQCGGQLDFYAASWMATYTSCHGPEGKPYGHNFTFKRFTLRSFVFCVKAGAFWQKLHFFQYSWSQIRFKIFTQLTVHTVHMVRYHMQRQEK